VSRLQYGWLKTMGVDVPWIAAQDPQALAPKTPKQQPTQHPSADLQSEQQAQPASILSPTSVVTAVKSLVSPVVSPAAPIQLQGLDLTQLADSVLACQRCGLCQARQHAVPGDGVTKPTILVVGEAPGEQEDAQGKPFVGRSGELLDNMLKAIGHDRQTSVFITNVVKCRPPANRNPRDEEIAACAPYLERQIELLAPKAILAMGRFAAHALLKTDAPLQKLREVPHSLALAGQSLPLVVTYHPAYLLRRPMDKRLAWEDLKRLRALLS
jgi:DNA polymerase